MKPLSQYRKWRLRTTLTYSHWRLRPTRNHSHNPESVNCEIRIRTSYLACHGLESRSRGRLSLETFRDLLILFTKIIDCYIKIGHDFLLLYFLRYIFDDHLPHAVLHKTRLIARSIWIRHWVINTVYFSRQDIMTRGILVRNTSTFGTSHLLWHITPGARNASVNTNTIHSLLWRLKNRCKINSYDTLNIFMMMCSVRRYIQFSIYASLRCKPWCLWRSCRGFESLLRHGRLPSCFSVSLCR
jgi:hypothetical protein